MVATHKSASWKLQVTNPRDQFENCTLTIIQWLQNSDQDGFGLQGTTAKWEAFMEASRLAIDGVQSQQGLRQEPRVGYDPAGDQPFFLFKASNNGTTFLVSPHGINLLSEEAES